MVVVMATAGGIGGFAPLLVIAAVCISAVALASKAKSAIPEQIVGRANEFTGRKTSAGNTGPSETVETQRSDEVEDSFQGVPYSFYAETSDEDSDKNDDED